MSTLTLVVYLARAGVGSRRACDELVRAGRVTIAGVRGRGTTVKVQVALEGSPRLAKRNVPERP